MKNNPRVHFVGIFGSGASGVAVAAKKLGFAVDGCDKTNDTPYAAQVVAAGIPVVIGHDAAHVSDADIVAVSPALLQQSEKVAEAAAAKAAGKLMTWQGFLGEYILPKFRLVAVCGTHGKTTTTAMTAHIMVEAGLDPTAFVGAIVPMWNSSNRFGASKWAVLEADEYANNFAPYRPEFVILNNLEMEHPEYFRDFAHYKETFRNFLANAKADGALVYNADDENAANVVDAFPGRKIPFSAKGVKAVAVPDGQDFDGFHINLLGAHNVSNAMAAITMARTIGVDDAAIQSALSTFRGTGHRLEKIYADARTMIYDDYAHHHTQVRATIEAVRAAHKDAKIFAIFEPHQISRYRDNTEATLDALATADYAVIADFWRGREANAPMPDVNADIAESGLKNVEFIKDHSSAAEAALEFAHRTDGQVVILVMGSGASWKIAKKLQGSFLSD